MADWVSTLCDKETFENNKRQQIAALSQQITETLKLEIENCVSAYNQRHRPDIPGNSAVLSEISPTPNGFQFRVKKNTNPPGEIAVDFPMNEARLKATGAGLPQHGVAYVIEVDTPATGGKPVESVYFVRGERRHRIPDLVQELLSPLLFPQLCTFTE